MRPMFGRQVLVTISHTLAPNVSALALTAAMVAILLGMALVANALRRPTSDRAARLRAYVAFVTHEPPALSVNDRETDDGINSADSLLRLLCLQAIRSDVEDFVATGNPPRREKPEPAGS